MKGILNCIILCASLLSVHGLLTPTIRPLPRLVPLKNPTSNRLVMDPPNRNQLVVQSTLTSVVSAATTTDSAAIINKAALKAIGKLLSTCGIGIWAGKKGILDQTALSVLSKLIFNVFQPCLLFVNVARTVANLSSGTAKGSAEAIFILPIAAALQVIVGFTVGKILSFLIYKNDQNSDEAKELMACATFANSGPLPLVFSEGLFQASSDATLVGRSAAYISLYLLGWSPLFWIVGPAILKPGDGGAAKDPKQARRELVTRIFSPPVVLSLLGMIVGFVPALRKLIVYPESPLSVVYEAMRTLGSAYLPAVLMVLSGSLAPPPASAAGAATVPKENKKVDKQFIMKVGSVYLSRFLLMPMIALGVLKLLSTVSPAMGALLAKDRLLLFVLLLESCMPSAQNTTVILQLQGNKAGATKLAQTLMMIYVLGVPALTFWLVQILKLTKLATV